MRRLRSIALAGALVLTRAGTTLAPKGENGHGNNSPNGSSATIAVPDGSFGGTTTAHVSPGGDGVRVDFVCYQNGLLVMAADVPLGGGTEATAQLGPTPMWSGGSATCTADAGSWTNSGRWVVSASTSFSVSG